MSDYTQTTQVSTTSTGNGAILVDKLKSPEQYIKEAESKYIVPKIIREKFSDLVKLIFETESMDQEEREYWLQIMPIMSEEQIVKFRDILVNEKKQLEQLDSKYESEMSTLNNKYVAEIDEAEMRKKMESLKQAEQVGEAGEMSEEAALLEELKNI
jgi:hypothetical protein